MNSSTAIESLALEERDQVALAAGYLAVMNAQLEHAPSHAQLIVRDHYRSTLAQGPLGPVNDAGALAIEVDDVAFEDLMFEVSDTARCLVLLVELCATEPFAGIEGATADDVRRRRLERIAIAMGGTVDEDDVEEITLALDEGVRVARRRRPPWLLIGAGGIVGVLTAGLAAPAIGAAIGGAMGLSGAAAASAGLALLGGGAVAAGGFGMAGGTAVIIGLGGLAGAGAGAGASRRIPPERINAEALRLFALAKSLHRYASAGETAADYAGLARECRDALKRLENELEREVLRMAESDQREALEDSARIAERLWKRLPEGTRA